MEVWLLPVRNWTPDSNPPFQRSYYQIFHSPQCRTDYSTWRDAYGNWFLRWRGDGSRTLHLRSLPLVQSNLFRCSFCSEDNRFWGLGRWGTRGGAKFERKAFTQQSISTKHAFQIRWLNANSDNAQDPYFTWHLTLFSARMSKVLIPSRIVVGTWVNLLCIYCSTQR